MSFANCVNVDELRRLAQRRLPRVVWDYLEGAAEDESTARDNRKVFERYRFLPNVATGNGKPDLAITLLGQRFSTPFLIGPTGLNGLFWPDADLALARAAAESDIGFILSTASNTSLEDIAEQAAGPRWFQLYPWGARELSLRLMQRAQVAGYSALVITVDSLTPGKRERDLRNGFSHNVRLTPRIMLEGLMRPRWLTSVWLGKGMPRFENIAEFLPEGATATEMAEFTRQQRNPYFSWTDIEELRRHWDGPLLVKGILAANDATRALNAGADGIIVSNHGGRQLDGALAALDALPAVVSAVSGKAALLIDGGFRRGTDIVKALALGADAVLLGRSPLYGLAAGGQMGVQRTIDILRDEISRTMGLLGSQNIAELSFQLVARSSPNSD